MGRIAEDLTSAFHPNLPSGIDSLLTIEIMTAIERKLPQMR